MEAIDLLTNLANTGITLQPVGDQLRVEGELTNKLRELIRQKKSDLTRLLDLKQEAGSDWDWIARDATRLAAWADLVQTNRLRERGEAPPHWTAKTTCKHCGPVPIWPGCPPKVSGCPWCFNRVSGKPMPKSFEYG